MDPAPDARKPYTTYRGGSPPRRGRRTRRGGVILVILLLVVVAAAAAAVVVKLKPFGSGDGAAGGPQRSAAQTASSSASPSPSPSPSATDLIPPGPAAVTITSGGDVIGGFAVSGVVASLGSDLFKSIAPSFEKSDFGFVNLESPLTTGGDPQGWKDVVIKGNPALAPAMAKSGINVVTMANNHAGDMGDSGLLDSIRYCESNGIAVVGAGRNLKQAQAGVVLKTSGGANGGGGAGATTRPARTAFLGFSDVLPVGYPATSTSPGTSPGRANLNAVKKNIRAAAKKADYVVVGWHWNFEYKRAPSYLESSEGKAAVDAGADLVIAAHPHLLDGVQAYHGGLIFYSLGNLVFSGFSGETAQTVLVRAKVTPRSIDAQLIPVTISGSGVPAVTGGSTGLSILQRVKSMSAALGTTVTIKGNRGYVHVKRKPKED
jgi:poly-gamma-glutamate synthesis protein (capsule biosynthesis protein)